jgi:hypothetical protein
MADIKPLGSERLDGLDKIKRIMEIAKYKDTATESINENSSTHYNITFADGNQYGIVKEKQGYIIKKMVSEGQADYIEPMQNRKYFPSYSQALKKLNLMIKENNAIVGNEEQVSLFGEQKKFVLKTPQAPAAEPVMDEPVAPELPAPELPSSVDSTEDAPSEDAPVDDISMDASAEVSEPMDNEPVSFKVIQKLTGKLTQKIRQFATEQEMSSEDIKYVINMVLSSVDLTNLSTEDKDEIMGKFESDEADAVIDGGDDKDGTDLTDDTEVEDIQNYMDVENDADMVDAGAEEQGFGETEEGEQSEQWQAAIAPAIERMAAGYVADKAIDKVSDMFSSVTADEGEVEEENKIERSILDHLFSESKVDKVLSKYFEVKDSEKRLIDEKKAQKNIQKKAKVGKIMESVKKLSVSVEQQLAAEKLMEENTSFSFVGRTNKKNLVFEIKNKQTKVTPEGLLV